MPRQATRQSTPDATKPHKALARPAWRLDLKFIVATPFSPTTATTKHLSIHAIERLATSRVYGSHIEALDRAEAYGQLVAKLRELSSRTSTLPILASCS